jgi:hypothetical protein
VGTPASDSTLDAAEVEPKLYEVINPSDAATFYASSDHVAVVAMLLLDGGRGQYGATACDGSFDGPLLMFQGEKWLEDHAIWPLGDWINEHLIELADALASVALGDRCDREDFDDAVTTIRDPGERAAFIKRRNDRRRSSLNDFESRAHEVAVSLRERAGGAS